MSIIIRLQNLPLNAKSGDIRKFFGGLRIPDGGVHILGGEKGDAFIAFMSDEDGRIAMRKDGGRIKDARVKLYLSSRMEMQHEVEKITKNNLTDISFPEDSTRPPDKRWRSRSPHHYKDWSIEHVKPEDHQRSMSPNPFNSRELSPIKYRSRSPQRKSRSPRKSFPSPKLPSFKPKSFTSKRKPVSPKVHNYDHSMPPINDFPQSMWENSESENYQNKCQAELEKRITEELEKGVALRKTLNEQETMPFDFNNFPQQNIPLGMEPSDMFYSHSAANNSSNIHLFQETGFQGSLDMKHGNLSTDVPAWSHKQMINDSFYVTLSGMDNNWSFREVQLILKGHFAPHVNIRWEKDDAGYKTGTAFVKLTNKDDFEKVIAKGVFYFNKRRITVSECPDFVAQNYFQLNSHFENEYYSPQNQDLCYVLKGLPFSCTYEDIINFFHGCEVADVIIFKGEDGRATGTGFVSFTNWKDFENAFSQNGKKIGHRYIEMLRSSDREMAEAKRTLPSGNFVPYSQILLEKNLLSSRRPLCALLTGLPVNVTRKKILLFFSESDLKPDAIHITLNNKKLSDGRAFVEFFNFLDFDLALKFHGKQLDNNVVCVKQILFDEMVKILDSQRAKHYFEKPVSTTSALTEPEKVPYLWEPPDAEQEKEIYNKDNRNNFPSDKLPGGNYSTSPYNITHGERFSPNDPFRRGPESFYNKTSPHTMPHLYQNQSDLETFEMKMHNIGNIQNHNNKHFMNAPGHMFGSTKKYEENIRSSRLSPENEAVLLDFLNRDRKPTPSRNNRPRSLERRKRNVFPEEFDDLKKYKDEQSGKLRSRGNLKMKNEKEGRHFDEKYDRSHVEINPSHFRSDKNEKCVVQLSNVDAAVGTRDLISFLRGYDFDEDTLIRRYTAEGDPTPDVRVTFNSNQEAKKAIKILNKQFLLGKKVIMFIAQ